MTKSGARFLPYLIAPRLSSILIHDNQVKTPLPMPNLDTLLFNSTERFGSSGSTASREQRL
jgi:hypothetical protein